MEVKSKKAWGIILCAVGGAIAIAIAQSKMMPCMKLIQAAFSIDKSEAGLLSSVFSVTGLIMTIPAAMIVNRIGERGTCLISLAFAIIGGLIGVAAQSFIIMFCSRVIEGIGAGLISIAVPGMISQLFPPEKKGLPTGLWTSWKFIAQAFCFSVGSFAALKWGWQAVWGINLLILAICFILNCFFVKMPMQAVNDDAEKTDKNQSNLKLFSGILNNKTAWLLSAAMFCYCFCYISQATWLASFWTERAGLESGYANSLLSYSALIAIPATLLIGSFSDRFSRKKLCGGAFALYAAVMFLGFLIKEKALIIVLIIVKPFIEASIATSLWAMIPLSARGRNEIPWSIALFSTMSHLAELVSSPVTGKAITFIGWKESGFILAGIALLGAILMAICPKRRNGFAGHGEL